MSALYCFGIGLGTHNSQGEWLEVYYAKPVVNPSPSLAAVITALQASTGDKILDASALNSLATALENAGVLSVFTDNTAPTSVPGTYLKLHLLSHRLVKPHETDLSGMFGTLPNVAWTNQGAIDINELPQRQLDARIKGEVLTVECVDKFPKMTNYVVPTGVRIAHTARVRLGAYIGEGTTVMHEGFVNFNAGTLGTSMIEGRISAGVVVGEGSDLGGGCSTMGTLSGGGNIVISVGKESLIGANAGIGIPLGDRCIVESGLYITAGTKVIRRNSLTGVIECKTNKTAIALNEELHANN